MPEIDLESLGCWSVTVSGRKIVLEIGRWAGSFQHHRMTLKIHVILLEIGGLQVNKKSIVNCSTQYNFYSI